MVSQKPPEDKLNHTYFEVVKGKIYNNLRADTLIFYRHLCMVLLILTMVLIISGSLPPILNFSNDILALLLNIAIFIFGFSDLIFNHSDKICKHKRSMDKHEDLARRIRNKKKDTSGIKKGDSDYFIDEYERIESSLDFYGFEVIAHNRAHKETGFGSEISVSWYIRWFKNFSKFTDKSLLKGDK